MERAADHDYFGLDSESVACPYRYFELARAEGAVWQEPHHNVFVVTRYADILEVNRRPDEFSSTVSTVGPTGAPLDEFGATPADRAAKAMEVPVRDGGTLGDLVRLDPPAHTNLRSLVNRLFTPKRMAELEPGMQALADRLIDAMVASGQVDFLAHVARPLTFLSICDLLGIPERDRDELLALSSIAEKQGTLAGRDIHRERHGTQRPFFEAYVTERRAHPRDDYLSVMANAATRDGALPSVEEVATMIVTIFGAGLETTMRTLGGMVHHLAEEPDQAAALRRRPEQLVAFIEEWMRYRSSVRGTFRFATADTELAGVSIGAGSLVYLAYAAGNHDPEAFDCPAEFDMGRADRREHLNFGIGIHYCIGHALARQEIRVALTSLLQRTSAIRPAPGQLEVGKLPTFLLDTVEHVHVELDPPRS